MLAGVRVVEFEGLGPAPFAAQHLVQLGADVTVIQRPASSAPVDTQALHRGKRSITLDLKDPTDHRVARALIQRSEILIEGFRPGVMERLGLGPRDTHQMNPALVYGRMTGWGQSGPEASRAGHDLNYLALSGALFYASPPGTPPVVPPTLLGDIGGGALYLVIGLLSGVLQARRTGSGTVVDAAIVDGASHMMGLLTSMGAAFSREARSASLLDGPPWSRCYACACGGHVSVQCLEAPFYAAFLSRLGLAEDPTMQAQHDSNLWPAQTALLEQVFATRTRDNWAALFQGTDACVAPVLSPSEARAHPHIAARGIWASDHPAPAPRFDDWSAPEADLCERGAASETLRAELREEGLIK